MMKAFLPFQVTLPWREMVDMLIKTKNKQKSSYWYTVYLSKHPNSRIIIVQYYLKLNQDIYPQSSAQFFFNK